MDWIDLFLLFGSTVLVIPTLFSTSYQNLIGAIQLTTITSRLTCLYIILIFCGWNDFAVLPLPSVHSMLFLISFILHLLHQTYLSRVAIASIILLFCPNLLFFFLLELQMIYFRHFATLLLLLQSIVLIFFWLAILAGDKSDASKMVRSFRKHPKLLFRSNILTTHFGYNILIVLHIWRNKFVSWSLTSWYLFLFFASIYLFMILLSYIVNQCLATLTIQPLYQLKSYHPILEHKILQSRFILFENYHCWGEITWNTSRVRRLLQNLLTCDEINEFTKGVQENKKDFLKWVMRRPNLYASGFIFLTSFLPYDILYLNVKQDGWLGWWKLGLLTFIIFSFINLLFLFNFEA